jgi:hypothetical protein
VISLDPDELVPKFHVALLASHAALRILLPKFHHKVVPSRYHQNFKNAAPPPPPKLKPEVKIQIECSTAQPKFAPVSLLCAITCHMPSPLVTVCLASTSYTYADFIQNVLTRYLTLFSSVPQSKCWNIILE